MEATRTMPPITLTKLFVNHKLFVHAWSDKHNNGCIVYLCSFGALLDLVNILMLFIIVSKGLLVKFADISVCYVIA